MGRVFGVCLFVWLCVLLCIPREGWAGKGKCEVCKNFVKAFEEGLKSTENANFAGGDTSWEEEKLGSYANSEVRFVEILDGVCSDYECHRLLEESEDHIERWWFKLRHKKPNLKLWFCHDQLDVCCSENKFGPLCEACPGGVDNPCGGQGTCEGAEEKDGPGTCRCNHGYMGDACLECDKGFYNDTTSCVACHRSCKDKCSGGGAGDCEECASGYVRSEEGGECKDVNECEEGGGEEGEGELLCEEGKYCFNTQGSYRCNDCDKSCEKACQGAGPARCLDCAAGYYKTKYNVCKDINECEGGEGWEGDPVTCEGDTFCENTAGSYQCKACHVACLGGCKGAGPTNCLQCKDGFNMDDGECKDVNECEEELPCEEENETCSNLIGSFKCSCKPGLVRMDGKCTEKVTKEKDLKKTKKKKKKGDKSAGKRQTDTVTVEQQEREREEERKRERREREEERREREEERRERWLREREEEKQRERERQKEREREREAERRVLEEEGERERKRRLGDVEEEERGEAETGGIAESRDQSLEADDLSQESHDHVNESPVQFEGSHDTTDELRDIIQSEQAFDLRDESERHEEL